MSYEDEIVCNEIIEKVQKLTSLLRSDIESTQEIALYLKANISEVQIPAVDDMDKASSFKSNASRLMDTLVEIKGALKKIHKSLEEDIEPELYKDLESSDLEFSDRLDLLDYAKGCSKSSDIVAAFVFRFLPDINDLLASISDSLLGQVSIDDLSAGAIDDVVKSVGVDYQTFLKDVNRILLSAPHGIQYANAIKTTLKVTQTL